ncbi:MAG: hypothetical protein ACJA1N_000962, partial [Saprospiraceae bacterium]
KRKLLNIKSTICKKQIANYIPTLSLRNRILIRSLENKTTKKEPIISDRLFI